MLKYNKKYYGNIFLIIGQAGQFLMRNCVKLFGTALNNTGLCETVWNNFKIERNNKELYVIIRNCKNNTELK
jgi:hypothetical protein